MSSEMTLRDCFRKYHVLRLRSASEETIRLWNVTLSRFDKYLGRDAVLGDLSDMTVSQFASARREVNAAATVNRDIATLTALWRFCNKQRMIDTWPNVQLETVPARAPRAWTQDEFDRLMQSISRMRLKMRGTEWHRSQWWTALVLVCFDTAERIGAILALRWDDIDIPGRWVRFRAETRKGSRRDLTMRIGEDTAVWVESLRRDKGRVFWHNYTHSTIYNQFSAIIKSAGLDDTLVSGPSKFHQIRRTAATHYAAAGGDPMKLLGHASQANTAKYLDPRILRPVAPHRVLFTPKINEQKEADHEQ